ncbi:conserved Plasmodium protein, unknown function [Plasmodium yoelii]|uniref:Uncharacterized protein n=3 Tax=Plasmodium yoelii TaxID=5861 RepID=A0AAF0B3B6_PLAYO|nr:conserved Plasmodium protein, unknown function [Plasmodium yoelii]EAA22038.1 hypothetical protein [Plasmodium yoelii yoelii]WBY55530.1 hypothetical protein Py17XNL_000504392 [Plasmodium yoelii yoelii]CDU16623.1 conserved Plasmodium protein, unknown function [Plasmodium yoelii]VTZ74070.1 conserved Plasmodium protein, unknown function [Plasmodium yoelii]|eukprot:XP_730473.1 conserved Plasmodium protein, unknown function [Plasmodium yoelii]
MVKIQKKLKGFTDGIKILGTFQNDKYGNDGNENDDIINNPLYKNFNDQRQTNINLDFNIKEEVIQKNINYKDLNLYVDQNDTSILLVILLYKILMKKPQNIVEYIINELNVILKQHTLENDENINSQSSDNNNNMKLPNCDDINKNQKDSLDKQYTIINPKPMELINNKTFLGDDILSLENLLNIVNFTKIQNSDQIYFNNLLKILKQFKNFKNDSILLNEKINPSDTIPMDKAFQLATLFYTNHFSSSFIN